MKHVKQAILALGAILALVVSFGPHAPHAAAAAPTYVITDLGTLSGPYSRAFGINNDGQVVGEVRTPDNVDRRAFLWSPTTANGTTGSMQDLGTLGGTESVVNAINASGQVVGSSETDTGEFHVFLWSPTTANGTTGSMQDLGTSDGTTTIAGGINASGQIAGFSECESFCSDTTPHGFRWTPTTPNGTSGSMLGLYSNESFSTAWDINAPGEVVGQAGFDSGYSHAFRWSDTNGNGADDAGEIVDLGALPDTTYSVGTSINDAGQVVGFSYPLYGQTAKAFLWSDSNTNGASDVGEMVDLGNLGGARTEAHGINAKGQVVGSSDTANGSTRAFLWDTTNSMQDLNNLLPASSGWILGVAYDINDAGQIVGVGTINGQGHAFLLTPTHGNQAPTSVDAGGPYAVAEGSSVTLTASGSDPEGNPLTYAWDLDNNGTFETTGKDVTFSAAGRDGNTSAKQAVSVQVCDHLAACTTDASTVDITNAAPTVNPLNVVTQRVKGKTLVTVSATFSDKGTTDTHTATWNWGDGSPIEQGTVSETSGSGSVMGSHTYPDGTYTITLTVADNDGAQVQSTYVLKLGAVKGGGKR